MSIPSDAAVPSPGYAPSNSSNATLYENFWEENKVLYARSYFWTLPVFVVAVIFLAVNIYWCVGDVKEHHRYKRELKTKKSAKT